MNSKDETSRNSGAINVAFRRSSRIAAGVSSNNIGIEEEKVAGGMRWKGNREREGKFGGEKYILL